jgi:4-carboxymuconolactone decarboxylase
VLTGHEAVVARTVAALAARGDLDDAEYRQAVEAVGTAGLFELLTLVGYYATLALQLRVFRVPAPEGATRPA